MCFYNMDKTCCLVTDGAFLNESINFDDFLINIKPFLLIFQDMYDLARKRDIPFGAVNRRCFSFSWLTCMDSPGRRFDGKSDVFYVVPLRATN